jgi:hypothetical protein
MPRKGLVGVATLLLIAALAVMAAGAQAATSPRWLQNGTEKKLEGGARFPVLLWGALQVENNKLGLVECKYAMGGAVTDPGIKGEGDLPGEAEVKGYTAYGCTMPVCEAAAGKVVFTPVGTEESKTVERITTPWEAHVTEPSAGVFHLNLGNKTKGSSTQIRFRWICAAQAVNSEFTGELTPVLEGGTAQGSAPARLEFRGAESGELESAQTSGGAVFRGKLNLFGYTEGQTLTVKNQ